jgi:hypothetical protein
VLPGARRPPGRRTGSRSLPPNSLPPVVSSVWIGGCQAVEEPLGVEPMADRERRFGVASMSPERRWRPSRAGDRGVGARGAADRADAEGSGAGADARGPRGLFLVVLGFLDEEPSSDARSARSWNISNEAVIWPCTRFTMYWGWAKVGPCSMAGAASVVRVAVTAVAVRAFQVSVPTIDTTRQTRRYGLTAPLLTPIAMTVGSNANGTAKPPVPSTPTARAVPRCSSGVKPQVCPAGDELRRRPAHRRARSCT